MYSALRPVIEVVDEKCVNCHACIDVCPVKYCIDGTGDTVKVIAELCIGCGACIAACTHGARRGLDDFDAFMAALSRKEKSIAIIAPAVAARFGEDRLRFNSWLRSLGVEAIYDVAFGAELTVQSYLKHIDVNRPSFVIAQPCPAIVSYIEIYQSELLPYLAPADSPMLHAIKMIKSENPGLADHKIVAISPCVAKRREFDETGLGDYNVTLERISEYLEEKKIDIHSFPELEFDGPPAERASLFSSPGGLKATVERERPELCERIRKMEGPEAIYPYLRELPASIAKGVNPLILDCLNCEKGCNGGTGTGLQQVPADILEAAVKARAEGQKTALTGRFRKSSAAAIRKLIRKHWKPNLFSRNYVDRSSSLRIAQPSEAELAAIYAKMLKTEERDFLNCAACGYGSCESMAIAIYNGLNKYENCQHYRQLALARDRATVADMSVALDAEIGDSTKDLGEVIALLPELSRFTSEQSVSLEDSTKRIEGLLGSLNRSSDLSALRREELSGLLDMAGAVQTELGASLSAIRTLKDQMHGVHDLVAGINKIASQTNLLSMNAAIEAAHAGDSGAGFAVVAAEIRNLADQAGTSASQIAKTLSAMTRDMDSTTAITERSGESIRSVLEKLASSATGMNEILDSLGAMSSDTDGIGAALQSLAATTHGLGGTYKRMEESLRSAAGEIDSIADISHANVRRMQLD
jgi:iron only hydrogenase large subunit-like protein